MSDILEGLAIGDLHYDKLANLFPESHVTLITREIDKTLQYAVRKGLKYVFFLGDICESSRLSYDSLCALIELIKKYDGTLNMFFILGNHDFDEHGVHSLQPFVTMYKCGMFKTTHVFSKQKILELEGVKVNFCPYPCKDGKANHVNVGHFEVAGSTRDNGTRISKGELTNFHWLMGHLHTPHEVGKVHYTGTLWQQNFGESLPKSFTHFKYRMRNGKLDYKLTRIPNDPTFKMINLVIESKRDISKIVKDELMLYKIFVNSGVDLPETLLEKYPNIVKRDGYSNEKELKALQEESFIEIKNQEIEEVSEEKYISDYLANKGRTKEQVQRGLELLTRVKENASGNNVQRRRTRVSSD